MPSLLVSVHPGFRIQGVQVPKLEALILNPIPYSPPYVDRIWLWAYYNNIPLYPIFYLLKGDY